MWAAFDASEKFEHDLLATAEEIQQSGVDVLAWLEQVAASETPRAVDLELIKDIHRREVEAILPAVIDACDTWSWRRENVAPGDEVALVRFLVAEANTLTVRVYDVHPFIDGNTRVVWHLRNYVLMLDGLLPLGDPQDESRYDEAWWAATPLEHIALDDAVLAELDAGER